MLELEIRTAADKAADAAEARARAVKAECRTRILAVLDQYTVSNIQGAALAGELDAVEMETFRAGRAWVAAMLTACRAATGTGEDPVWPDVPAGVSALAARF